MRPKLCVIQVAALSPEVVEVCSALRDALPGEARPLHPIFPALTCPAQATFRTAAPPARHGIVANGLYDRAACRADFWNQSAHLVHGPRIWENFRRRGGSVGIMFWQQSLGEAVDVVLSPAPIHKHEGGMIPDCYAQPPGLYARLRREIGRRFPLIHYWGPLASRRSSEWIADAGAALLRSPRECPDLLLTYLPHLDYALQKYGPDDRARVERTANELARPLGRLVDAAREAGYRVLVWGDYGIRAVRRPVYPNRALREAGLFRVREVRGRLYPDLYASRAFAMVDHQIAHLFAKSATDAEAAEAVLRDLPGVEAVLPHGALPHPASGDRLLLAAAGAWFAYPWWDVPREAPDYAVHVDIHNKPGYDPCELFWGGFFPPRVSLDAARIRGSHGRPGVPACFATDLALDDTPEDPAALGAAVGAVLRAG